MRALAQAFLGWGAKKGDRIALVAENRWEWAVADFAALAIGAADVPIYPTLPGEHIAELIADAGCRIAVVSTRQQFDKLNSVRGLTQLERIVIMESPAPQGAVGFGSLIGGADARGSQRDPIFDALVRAAEPDDLATLIYTSGTTGEPKGVALTHGNIAANQNCAAADFDFNASDSCISFLPLSHITARALDYIMYYYGAQVAYCSQFDKLPQAMREIRPSVFVGVPRVFEKIRQAVEQKSAASPVKKRILGWALGVGSAHGETVYDGRRPASPLWKLADKLAFSKVREAFGGRVRVFVSGGAPLGIDTGKWFAAVGIALYEGYGLTETSPVIALNTPLHHRMGSVGRTLPNVELKFAEDGELLTRGPAVFAGYWRKPEANAQCFDSEGWFRTGDIARMDADGIPLHYRPQEGAAENLRRQDGGAAADREQAEEQHSCGAGGVGGRQAQVHLGAYLAELRCAGGVGAARGIAAGSRAELVADSRVVARYGEIVREVNGTLANFESLKRFRVVADEWTQETGELTPSMKLKRRVLTESICGRDR